MSKHLLEALAALSHMSLTQTVDCGNCEPFSGTLNIHLKDVDEQGNMTSAADTRYVNVSDSHGNNSIHEVVLHNGEGTLTLNGLDAIQMSVVQVDERGRQMMDGDAFHITYLVNGEAVEEDYATHVFHSANPNQELIIMNQMIPPTTLTLTKVLFDEFQEMMDFEPDMNFAIQIEGMGRCEVVDLNMRNHFQATLTLKAGEYCLFEEEDECYHTRFSLDGREPKNSGIICLEGGAHEVQIINQKRTHSVLTLDKYIRDLNGELIKPQDHECFRVRVIGDFVDEIVELHADNDFAMDLCDLPNGFYDVQEMDCDCYETTYLVNAEKESDYAHVEMRECRSSSVLIINNPDNCCEQDSPLRICKYVRRSDGCLVKPDPCLSFKVMLAGCGVCETFNLNASNNYCVDIEHICCGEYEVRELDSCDFVASYIVNDNCETTRAFLCVHEGARNCVQIINEERNKGEVSICKVLRDSCGDFVKPDKNQRFLVTLRSYFCRETFVLDSSNEFCVHVSNLREGSYEVKERRCDGFDTTYIVDGCEEAKKARFLVANGCCSDVKIINTPCKEPSGDLRICKYIANDFGDYVKPAADEEFEIQVQGPCVDNCYVLRAANNWCVILEGLKKGVYRVIENDACNYTSQYIVNGCEMDDALICMDACNQEVQIINTRRNFGNLKLSAVIRNCDDCIVKPGPNEHFDILVEGICDSRCVTLDACNNFCVLLEDLEKGRYRITQKDNFGYKVLYEIDGEVSPNALVTMEGCNVAVTIVNQMMNCSGIVRVRKWVELLNGKIIRPCEDDCYDFRLVSRCMDNMYTLSKRNDFCVFFDDLEEGTYEVIEESCANMDVYYRINGEICDCGRFDLRRDDIEVDIINKVMPLPKVCIHKRIRENGCLVKPEDCESFEFMIKGRGMHEVYCLNAENDWCVCLEGLCNQHYEISEIGVDCHTIYQINDQLCEQGYFLFEDKDMEVIIINEDVMEPIVTIRKWMEDDCKNRVKPCRDDCFEVMIEGDCYKQCFALHEENDWCILLEGLACGCYTIRERGCGYRARIMINDCESEEGMFEVGEKDLMIDVINAQGYANTLSIFAYEYVDGEECTPSEDKCYHVEVTCEKQKENFLLDKSNDWCIALEDINAGCYRIYVKDNMSIIYEMDGECFENAIDVDVECGDVCVKLLDPTYPQRDITISKRQRMANGDVKRPPRGSCYEVTLRGECKECVELNEANDWCACFEDMPAGIYEVKESCMDGAMYQIDGQTPCAQGYFTLENKPISVVIINPEAMKPNNSLMMRAMVKNCDGDLEGAPRDTAFEVMLDGDGVREDFTLNERNGFQMCLKDLANGDYTITQKANEDYTRVTYCVNGKEQGDGAFTLHEEDMQIDLINYMNCERGSIRIMKYIKDESCGCLKRPYAEDSFDVEIMGADFEQTVVLNASNKWCYVFDHLADGDYTIRETSGSDMVTYIVNGGKETNEANLHIHGNEANVKIINAKASGPKKGSIELAKVMRDEAGNYIQPSDDDSYWVSIKGQTTTQRILLHSANHFFVEVRGLEDGLYEVMEEDAINVMYSINGGNEQARAILHVHGNTTSVNVINAMHEKGEITLTKYVQSADGSLQTPPNGQSYRVHVSRPGFNTVVVLDGVNNYTSTLRDLESGMYVIDELDHEDVTYIINGGSQVDRAIVNVNRDMHDVQIINREGVMKGSIRMMKFVRNMQNQLVRPDASASYQFQVSKPGYNQLFTLNYANNWSIDLLNLDDGNYVINETTGGAQNVSFIINDGTETDYGIVNVQGNANNVQIINGAQPQNAGSILVSKLLRDANGDLRPPVGMEVFTFYISKPNFYQVYTLNANNNWGTLVSNLEDGDYVITEVNPDANVTYIVNGGSEVNDAVVNVRGNENDVQIINANRVGTSGSITVTKYVRNETEDLVRPSGDFAVRVQLLKTGYNEVVTLDFTNNWTYTFADLEDGDYVLNEINSPYGTSWIIDGKPEVRYAVILVRKDDHQADMINTIRQGEGSITITKFVRNANGELVRPDADARYLFFVSKPGFSQSYILMANNNWSILIPNLEDGNYVLSEGGSETNVSYIINGGSETNFGIVNVRANANTVQAINSSRASGNGSITITKYIRDASGSLIRPTGAFTARVHVSRPGFNEVFTLNAVNDWTILIVDLMDGEYVLNEVDSEDQVTWRVNGGNEVSYGVVAVAQNDNQVNMIDTPVNGAGSMQISKYMRNALGQLVRPNANEIFMAQISGPVNRFVTLDTNNQWNARVSGLPAGNYQVREISTSDYTITYIVNDGDETPNANVTIDQNEASIGIINSAGGNRNVLEIKKYIKNANGTLETPAEGDEYSVEVSGDNYQETFTLNGDNQFTQRVVNLADGNYTVTELSGGGFTVTYRVNGGQESSSAMITVSEGQNNIVEIMNEMSQNRNTLDVFKFIMDEFGNFQKPLTNQVFRFLLTGGNIHQYYTLSSANDWHVFIDTLDSGEYEVIEQSTNLYDVRYLINGGEFSESGVFSATPGAQNIIEIINQPVRSELGSLMLEKKIRTMEGDLIIPGNGLSFDVRVQNSRANFDQTVTLNESNGYLLMLSDLPYGVYTVTEVNNGTYRVSYIVNEGSEQSEASVNIQTMNQQNVMIINTQTDMVVNARHKSDIRIVIE